MVTILKCVQSSLVEYVIILIFCNVCFIGNLIPINVKEEKLGGSALVEFGCSGCLSTIPFQSSEMALIAGRKHCTPLAATLAFLIWGGGFHTYHKIMGCGLGLKHHSHPLVYDVIKIAHPVMRMVLNRICSTGKAAMKQLPDDQLGSWKKLLPLPMDVG